MHIALHMKRRLHFGKDLQSLQSLNRHSNIEPWVYDRERMDIMESGIAIEDLHRLTRHHAKDMGCIDTTFLAERHRRAGCRISAGYAIFDKDQCILQGSVDAYLNFLAQGRRL